MKRRYLRRRTFHGQGGDELQPLLEIFMHLQEPLYILVDGRPRRQRRGENLTR